MRRYILLFVLFLTLNNLNSLTVEFENIINVKLLNINTIINESKIRAKKDTNIYIKTSLIPKLSINSGIGLPYSLYGNQSISLRGDNIVRLSLFLDFSQAAHKVYEKKYVFNSLRLDIIKLYTNLQKKLIESKILLDSSQLNIESMNTMDKVRLIELYMSIINLEMEIYSISNISFEYDGNQIIYNLDTISSILSEACNSLLKN